MVAADRGDLLDNVSKPIVLFLHASTLMKCGSHSTEPLRKILTARNRHGGYVSFRNPRTSGQLRAGLLVWAVLLGTASLIVHGQGQAPLHRAARRRRAAADVLTARGDPAAEVRLQPAVPGPDSIQPVIGSR